MKIFFILLSLILFQNTLTYADDNTSKKQNIDIDKNLETIQKIYKNDNMQSISKIELIYSQPINWYLILLPISTIVIVIASFLMTRRQLEEKTKESINSFDKTIEKQTELSKNEIKLEVLSKNRQAWINSLRNELSEFMGLVSAIKNHTIIMRGDERLVSVKDNFNKIRIDTNKLDTIKYKIYLLINPNEENSKKLIALLEPIKTKVLQEENVDNEIQQLIDISQKILKYEWNRVKELK